MICRPLSYGEGFVRGVLEFVDCQAQNIGGQGYQALAAPGSAVSLAITAMLTILVALYGYRMMFGHVPSARDGVLTLAKIGIVLALATSWPAYRAMVYDVALRGPAQLAGDVGRPSRLPGSDGGLVGRLQGVDSGLLLLNEYGVGKPDPNQKVRRERVVNGRTETVTEPAQRQPDQFDQAALGWSRILFLTGTIGALAAVRLVSGLLLALGPFFIAFLLFDGTRGLFEGWVRGLGGAALGAVAVTILLGAELALVEPWLTYLLAMREAQLSIIGAPVELMVVMAVFALALAAALYAAARVAMGFRLPAAWRDAGARVASTLRSDAPAQPRLAVVNHSMPAEQRSRAVAVAEAVASTQRREQIAAVASVGGAPRGASPALSRDLPPPGPVPLGQSYGSRARTRVSGSSGRRDRRS